MLLTEENVLLQVEVVEVPDLARPSHIDGAPGSKHPSHMRVRIHDRPDIKVLAQLKLPGLVLFKPRQPVQLGPAPDSQVLKSLETSEIRDDGRVTLRGQLADAQGQIRRLAAQIPPSSDRPNRGSAADPQEGPACDA
jgi:hypothetical protein